MLRESGRNLQLVCNRIPSRETIKQFIIELSVIYDFITALKLAKAKNIGMDFDGTKKKSYSIVGGNLFFQDEQKNFQKRILGIREMIDHSSLGHFEALEDFIDQIKEIQIKLNLPQEEHLNFEKLKFLLLDNCSVNFGKKNGLSVLVKKENYSLLSLHCCDHLSHLVMNHSFLGMEKTFSGKDLRFQSCTMMILSNLLNQLNHDNQKFRKWYYHKSKKNLKKQNKSKTIRFLSAAHAIYESVKILPEISEYLLKVNDFKGLLEMLQNKFLFACLITTAIMWKSWFSPFMFKVNQVQPLNQLVYLIESTIIGLKHLFYVLSDLSRFWDPIHPTNQKKEIFPNCDFLTEQGRRAYEILQTEKCVNLSEKLNNQLKIAIDHFGNVIQSQFQKHLELFLQEVKSCKEDLLVVGTTRNVESLFGKISHWVRSGWSSSLMFESLTKAKQGAKDIRETNSQRYQYINIWINQRQLLTQETKKKDELFH